MRNRVILFTIALGIAGGLTAPAPAFKLSPQGTAIEQAVARKYSNWWRRIVGGLIEKGLPHFSEAVHEEITHRIYGCQGDPDVCGNPDAGFASPYLVAGVRWNDDPPFRLEEGEGKGTSCKLQETIRFTTQPKCWWELFGDAKKKAEAGKVLDAASRTSLLGRSHFGDLQFLHAMASRDGELALDTKKRVIMWAQFAWRIALGEFSSGTKLKEVPIDGMTEHFGRTEWTIQDLFTLGNPPLRTRIKEVAFGSFLHIVEDSFAKGHVDRAEAIEGQTCERVKEYPVPGLIRSFHAYGNQDTTEHAKYDSRDMFSAHWSINKPSVIDVAQVFLQYLGRGSAWENVSPYLDCVFLLQDPSARASAGNGFDRKLR